MIYYGIPLDVESLVSSCSYQCLVQDAMLALTLLKGWPSALTFIERHCRGYFSVNCLHGALFRLLFQWVALAEGPRPLTILLRLPFNELPSLISRIAKALGEPAEDAFW
ncbi:hypothetical protein FNV43_RR10268 [Rhamnella rubrinervis]|uniref:Uncharacterized protein n=1 Tax=Rhamnella rubrinervis TaxID=2594499 RepID=A0A8K0MKL1_9ROSA|nr:hypothetical protein FNV43_RR10268 [Rhamnella rubrinervis]